MVSGTAVWIEYAGHHVTVGWLRRSHGCDRREAKFVAPNERWHFGPRTAGLLVRVAQVAVGDIVLAIGSPLGLGGTVTG